MRPLFIKQFHPALTKLHVALITMALGLGAGYGIIKYMDYKANLKLAAKKAILMAIQKAVVSNLEKYHQYPTMADIEARMMQVEKTENFEGLHAMPAGSFFVPLDSDSTSGYLTVNGSIVRVYAYSDADCTVLVTPDSAICSDDTNLTTHLTSPGTCKASQPLDDTYRIACMSFDPPQQNTSK